MNPRPREAIAPGVMVPEMAVVDESERECSDPEIESPAVAHPEISEPVRAVIRHGRQGCPAAVGRMSSPEDPGRPPHPIRPPKPAVMGVAPPSPIMEWSPSPRIIRLPIPPGIGVIPSSCVAIRPPLGRGDRHGRSPRPAVARDVHPGSVRRKGCVKLGCHGSCRGCCIDHLRLSGRGGQSGGGGLRHGGDGRRNDHRSLHNCCCRGCGPGVPPALDQDRGDRRRSSQVMEVDQLLGRGLGCNRQIGRVGQHDGFFDAGLCQAGDLLDGGRERRHRGGQGLDCQRGIRVEGLGRGSGGGNNRGRRHRRGSHDNGLARDRRRDCLLRAGLVAGTAAGNHTNACHRQAEPGKNRLHNLGADR